jgi:hypothetical protein
VATRRPRPRRCDSPDPRLQERVLALSSSYSNPPGTSTYPLNIGRNPGGAQRFRGLIDEVRIYNQVLTAAEVQALHDQGGVFSFFGLS